MFALLVVDVQNEFSSAGLRAVPNHDSALTRIGEWVGKANLCTARSAKREGGEGRGK